MIRLYEEIVGRGGVSPTHFFYEMTFSECAAYMRGLDLRERNEWERTRQMMWAAIMPHSRKKLDVEDVLKFSWDEGYIDTSKVDEKELERVRELAKNIKL